MIVLSYYILKGKLLNRSRNEKQKTKNATWADVNCKTMFLHNYIQKDISHLFDHLRQRSCVLQ